MQTKHRSFLTGKLGGAALWVTFATLASCNVVAGLLGVGGGFSSSPEINWGPAAPIAPRREINVSLRPGVSLFQAAAQLPQAVAALARASSGLGDGALLNDLGTIGANLLDAGLLIPGPLGMLEVRREVQPIVGEAIAVTMAPVDATTVMPAPGCPAALTRPAVVGAYRADHQLLILRTDGQYVLQGGAEPVQTGRYQLDCQVLQLVHDSGYVELLTPREPAGWRHHDREFLPLTEQPHGDAR